MSTAVIPELDGPRFGGKASSGLRAWVYAPVNRDAIELVVVPDYWASPGDGPSGRSEVLCGDGVWRSYGEFEEVCAGDRSPTMSISGADLAKRRRDRALTRGEMAALWREFAPAWLRYHPVADLIDLVDRAFAHFGREQRQG